MIDLVAHSSSSAEKTGILRAAATRENDKTASFECKLLMGHGTVGAA
jgi:hypothetical protein